MPAVLRWVKNPPYNYPMAAGFLGWLVIDPPILHRGLVQARAMWSLCQMATEMDFLWTSSPMQRRSLVVREMFLNHFCFGVRLFLVVSFLMRVWFGFCDITNIDMEV